MTRRDLMLRLFGAGGLLVMPPAVKYFVIRQPERRFAPEFCFQARFMSPEALARLPQPIRPFTVGGLEYYGFIIHPNWLRPEHQALLGEMLARSR